MFDLEATAASLAEIHMATAVSLASAAAKKFGEISRAGMFNRYSVVNKKGKSKAFLVYFESDSKAIVMTYQEALELPVLGNKCREAWKD